ncbi:MAG: hypothetical protein BWY19_00194 [bacterium ADurb.Bin212]|nr:MAG: hypothetical protein BWY19_00194 [bacterium ADurb.Bin212]
MPEIVAPVDGNNQCVLPVKSSPPVVASMSLLAFESLTETLEAVGEEAVTLRFQAEPLEEEVRVTLVLVDCPLILMALKA